MNDTGKSAWEGRVLVLAPGAADEALGRTILARARLAGRVCGDVGSLCRELEHGADAVLLAQQALAGGGPGRLVEALRKQPPWSDLPVLLLTDSEADPPPDGELEPLGNVTILERQAGLTTLASALRAAVRARRLQYRLRDRMDALAPVQDSHRAKEGASPLTERDRPSLQVERLPLAYVLMDADNRVLDWNPAAERIFGYAREEVLGRVLFDLIVELPLNEPLQGVLGRLRAGDMDAHSVNENRTRDGRVIVCEWFNTPLRDAEGRYTGAICLAQDVTERRRVEGMLEQSGRRFQAVFENALEPILLTDDAGRYVDGNPACCEMLGYGREELRRLTVWDVTPPELRPRIPEALRRFLAAGSLSGEHVLLCKGGATRVVEFRSVANILPGLHLGIHRDVTESKRAADEMRDYSERVQALSRRLMSAQEDERCRLARELHDEFGQVLATITLHLHAAKGLAGEAARPRLEDCAALLRQAGEQVRGLALNLRPAMLETLGLESTLRSLAEQHRQRTGAEAQVVGHLSGAPLPPDLMIACFRVAQEALTNVVRHAQARHVWIELSQSESALEVAVRDDGVGFEVGPTQQEAFRRGRLGLLGMAERAQLLGGALHVESEPGRGACIRASFPTGEAPEEPQE